MLILSAIYDNATGLNILKPFMNEFAYRTDEGIVKKRVNTIYNVEGLSDIKTGEVYSYGAHQVFVPNELHTTISKYYEVIYSFRDTHGQSMKVSEFLQQTVEKADSLEDFCNIDPEEFKDEYSDSLEIEIPLNISELEKPITSRPVNPPPMVKPVNYNNTTE